ncbi:hypothetical protein BX666DRAFT_1863482 [Dichotomocladium elegans]|nr:hypothetical protein BX666DRAFT_1863482 [Dichotomocladium elegans]
MSLVVSCFVRCNFSTHINKQRVNRKFVNRLDAKFGPDAVYIMGNSTQFRESLREKEF